MPFKPEHVINGTWGELWLDGSKVAECKGLQAVVKLEKDEVPMCGRLSKGQKVNGYECTGTLKLHKVTSRMIKRLSDDMKKGKQTPCTIISKLADPDSLGAERIVLKDVVFDELTLADWEVKKNLEESIPFTFTDWDLLDTIDPSLVGE